MSLESILTLTNIGFFVHYCVARATTILFLIVAGEAVLIQSELSWNAQHDEKNADEVADSHGDKGTVRPDLERNGPQHVAKDAGKALTCQEQPDIITW